MDFNHFLTSYMPNTNIGSKVHFDNMLNETISNLPTIGETDSYKRILDFIHKKKSVSKADILDYLNWGVRISFTSYRNRLRNEKTIKFTKDRYEVR